MIIDLRKQKRVINIIVKKIGYDKNIDDFIDELVKDIKIICEQRNIKKLEIEITLK